MLEDDAAPPDDVGVGCGRQDILLDQLGQACRRPAAVLQPAPQRTDKLAAVGCGKQQHVVFRDPVAPRQRADLDDTEAPALLQRSDPDQGTTTTKQEQSQMIEPGPGEMSPPAVLPFPGLEWRRQVELQDESIPVVAQLGKAGLAVDDLQR